MEAKDKKTAKVAARVTAAQKKRYTKLAQDLYITEADLVRRAMDYYAHQCQSELEWIEAGADMRTARD